MNSLFNLPQPVLEVTNIILKETTNCSYYCTETNYRGCMLKYPDLPKINTGPPASLTTIEGNNASLPCSASGIPKPTITWYKNGQALDSANYDADSGMLTLNNIHFADQGVYKCEARNFLGFDSATVELFVQGRCYLRPVSNVVLLPCQTQLIELNSTLARQ